MSGWQYVHGQFVSEFTHPFLAKYIIGLSLLLFGKSDFAARFPAAVAEIISVLFIYLLTMKMSNRYCGFFASLLFATSPLVISYSKLALLDPFMVCFFVVTLYCFWVALEEGKRNYFLFGGLSLGLSVATKYSALILLPIMFVYIVVYHKGLIMGDESGFFVLKIDSYLAYSATLSFLTFSATFLPSLSTFPRVLQEIVSTWIPYISGTKAYLQVTEPPWAYLYWYLASFSVPMLLAYMLAVGGALYYREKSFMYLLLSSFLPFLAFSFISSKNFRYALIFEPGLSMLAALVLSKMLNRMHVNSLPRIKKKFLKICIIGFITCLIIVGGITALSVNQTQYHQKTGYKTAAEYLEEHTGKGETIMVWGYQELLRWYIPDRNVTGWFGPTRNEKSILWTIEGTSTQYILVSQNHVERWPNDPIVSYLEGNTYVVYSCPSPDGEARIYKTILS